MFKKFGLMAVVMIGLMFVMPIASYGETVIGAEATVISNIALNKPASSNSVLDPGAFAAFKVSDGNSGTRWVSASNDAELEVDLGGFYEIDRVRISWEAASSIHYEVLTSIDGVNYTQVLDVDGLTTGADRTDDWSFASTGGIRFVKLKNITSWVGIVSIWEFEVYGVPATPNIALNKPASSNSVLDPGAFAAFKANDGNAGTRWVSASNDAEWEIDLGGFYEIDRIRVKWEAASSIHYEVLTSIDGVNYTQLLEVDGLITGADRTDDWSFAPTSGIRFVKLKNITSWVGIVSVWEFEVFPASTNIALNKPTSSNSVLDPGAFAAVLANDGNAGTRWVSASNDAEWEVDLGGLYEVDRIRIDWEAASSIHYEVLTSTDGVNYTQLLEFSGLNPWIRTDDWSFFAPTSGVRFVKLSNITSWAGIVSVWEFEVYGVPVSTNIALNKPASSTSVLDPGAFAAFKANDGNAGTRWVSASNDAEWEVDLGGFYDINRIRINWEAASSIYYEVLTSTDGVNYAQLLEFSGLNPWIRTDDWSFFASSGCARFVKLRNITSWAGIVSMWEFEVYGIPIDDCDGDDYTSAEGDCDDTDASIFPGACEIAGDGIDQNCDGSDVPAVPVCADGADGSGNGLWKNHGQFVSTIVNYYDTYGTLLCLTGVEIDEAISEAAKSDCGMPGDGSRTQPGKGIGRQ